MPIHGVPGESYLTRGPGAAHGAVGIHTAAQDSTPMLCLIGQVPRGELGREALQEVDYRAMFAPLAKWVEEVTDAHRIPELVRRAFQVATAGRPGPVVLSFPEDVLAEEALTDDAQPFAPAVAAVDPDALARVRARLAAAERPLMIVGGGRWSAETAAAARAFAEASRLPVACAFRCHDFIDSRSPSYAGHLPLREAPALARRVREADLLLVVGDRLGDVTTGGYALVEAPSPRQTLIHVYPEPAKIGRGSPGARRRQRLGGVLRCDRAGRRIALGRPPPRRPAPSGSPGARRPRPAPRSTSASPRPPRGSSARRSSSPSPATSTAGSAATCRWRGYRRQLMPQSGAMG